MHPVKLDRALLVARLAGADEGLPVSLPLEPDGLAASYHLALETGELRLELASEIGEFHLEPEDPLGREGELHHPVRNQLAGQHDHPAYAIDFQAPHPFVHI